MSGSSCIHYQPSLCLAQFQRGDGRTWRLDAPASSSGDRYASGSRMHRRFDTSQVGEFISVSSASGCAFIVIVILKRKTRSKAVHSAFILSSYFTQTSPCFRAALSFILNSKSTQLSHRKCQRVKPHNDCCAIA